METPFIFGKLAGETFFTDRDNETSRMITNFKNGINTILISPRRWGKSSLVLHASKLVQKKDPKIVFTYIDLFNIRSEEQFYQVLTKEILKSTASKLEELIANSQKFFKSIIPKFNFSPLPNMDFSIALDWDEVKKQPEELLNLAENIAIDKKIKIVICIDEFQNISEFENPLAFQKTLRANWQKHQNTSYCLYGSKRHMMTEVFSSYSMPFYKFGDILFLEKIKKEDWIPFIMEKFTQTKKEIHPESAGLIATMVECHPYYVQQLAQLTWLRTAKKCNDTQVMEAFESLVMQLSLLFQTITDTLTSTQINLLHAIINEVPKLSSKETLYNYKLGTSANVLRIRHSLVFKEIIDIQNNKIEFLDPVYKYWLAKYYLKI
jgi:hypothetical protein